MKGSREVYNSAIVSFDLCRLLSKFQIISSVNLSVESTKHAANGGDKLTPYWCRQSYTQRGFLRIS